MQENWRNFLRAQQALIENGQVVHFGDPVSELAHTQAGTILVDLSHYGLLGLSGADAGVFLQNQLSCDVREVSADQAKYGSYCTPKGRVLANFIIMDIDGEWLLQLPMDLCASIQKRLSMFVLRSKVDIHDRSGQYVRMGIAGAQANKLVASIAGTRLDLDNGSALKIIHSEHAHVICHAPDRFELIVSEKDAQELWCLFNGNARPAGAACWRWREIHEGVPVITTATQEQFLPQMINLDIIGGVSFKKGCYPGQEIVARTQFLGKLKRRMCLAKIATGEPVNDGDDVFSTEMQDQSCGTIVNAVPSVEGGYDVLAVIQQNSINAGSLFWRKPGGPELIIGTLPYILD
ncbi:YgfZ/GcvT domain-containing protein [Nitrosomonas marina]|uniref:GCVT N-terminal domain-containing protein n=1 Tax=Nitrosomonas marina TaxID=917 RepID=A0A1H8AGY4_9PROT|nr:folate-binding protein YgfZ [Nitrosomonas marina]SEM70072.1 hypothetical protein SAMN05216325_101147 [Nitrosomonas marina]